MLDKNVIMQRGRDLWCVQLQLCWQASRCESPIGKDKVIALLPFPLGLIFFVFRCRLYRNFFVSRQKDLKYANRILIFCLTKTFFYSGCWIDLLQLTATWPAGLKRNLGSFLLRGCLFFTLRSTPRESTGLRVPVEQDRAKGLFDERLSQNSVCLLPKWHVAPVFQSCIAIWLLQLQKKDIVRKTSFILSLLPASV